MTAPKRTAVAERLARAAEQGRPVRPVGGATKLAWGANGAAEPVPVGAGSVRELNPGDLTAVVDAGVTLSAFNREAAAHGLMLALDPPLGEGGRATLGGVVATNDSGPLRHRYGSARDLVVGITVALADGSIAKSGGKVIKNVAGYDLAKLFTGSFGTLGTILDLSLRLHPLPPATATALGRGTDPGTLAAAAIELSHAQIELQSLDVRWDDGEGTVLARFGGAAPAEPARAAAASMAHAGLDAATVDPDAEVWDAQRSGQRSATGTVVRVSGVQTQLADVMEAARELDAGVVARAGLGLAWVTLETDAAQGLAALREALSPAPCVVLDSPADVRGTLDVWGPQDAGALALMRRVKERFDPRGVCAPGVLAV